MRSCTTAMLGSHIIGPTSRTRWVAGSRPPCRAPSLRCCCRTDSCASVLQPLTGDRVVDRTFVGHQATTKSSFCSPVHNTWANGMRPHCPPSSVLVQHTSKGVGARNSALCDCVCTYVSACVCVCTVCVHCVCALCVCFCLCVCAASNRHACSTCVPLLSASLAGVRRMCVRLLLRMFVRLCVWRLMGAHVHRLARCRLHQVH